MDKGDPIVPIVKDVVANVLDTRVKSLFLSGEVYVRSHDKFASLPDWAWGGETVRQVAPFIRLWINPDLTDEEKAYVVTHETGHAFDDLFLGKSAHGVLMSRMLLIDPDGQGWYEGTYDNHACFKPNEGFADSFAKAQGAGRFDSILPKFYKNRVAKSNRAWLMDVATSSARR
jgi:hypothetical protein